MRITEDPNEGWVRNAPGQATALPSSTMCTSPFGCAKPRKRPGTIGMGSLSLFTREKSSICVNGWFPIMVIVSSPRLHPQDPDLMERTLSSKKSTKLGAPTRGVPYVTPLTVMSAGRFRRIMSVSSSAMAPPRECPIYTAKL
jgi:hypothetical protein